MSGGKKQAQIHSKSTRNLRLRVGNYRVVFEIKPPQGEEEKPTMAILFAGHRKDVYRRLK